MDLTQAKTSIQGMLARDGKPADPINPNCFSQLDLDWAETQIEGMAKVLRHQGGAAAIEQIAAGNDHDKVKTGLTMLLRVADMPAKDAPEAPFQLLAADMLGHAAVSRGHDENAQLYYLARDMTKEHERQAAMKHTPHVVRHPVHVHGPRSGRDLICD